MVAAGVAATIDPEELLWMPGKKKIFVPAPEVIQCWTFRKTAFVIGRWIDVPPTDTAVREMNAAIEKLRLLPGPVRVSSWSKA